MKLALLAMGACLALAGCASTKVELSVSQAMLVAEAGADGVNNGAIIAAKSGALHGPAAAKVKTAVDLTNEAVNAAHAATTSGAAAAVAQALTDIANAQSTIKGASAQ